MAQGHQFIDVELKASYTTSRDIPTPAANQRAALNDVTTTSQPHDPDDGDVAANDDEEDDDDDDDGCRANCCAVQLSVCCRDNDKPVSLSLQTKS